MIERVWLASYPKSGNTWLRLLISCLGLKPGQEVDINRMTGAEGISSARDLFEAEMLLDSGLFTHDEIDRMLPRVHEQPIERRPDFDYEDDETQLGVQFRKTHDGYILTGNGEPLLAGRRGAKGVILVVRDPRDVASSFANHMQVTVDRAIQVMNNPDAVFGGTDHRLDHQLRQCVGRWSDYAAGWLDQNDIPVHLVRYEDLKRDTAGVFMAAMAFAGCSVAREQAEHAAQLCDFARLQTQERERGFGEKPPNVSQFFRRGQTGGWRDELTEGQALRIESCHGAMMERLGYELASGSRLSASR